MPDTDTEDQIQIDDEEAFEHEVQMALVRQVPIGLIFARILVVSGMSFAAAGAIFCVIGAIWLPALACAGVTLLFLFLMFFIERGAERHSHARP
ncbi:MAG TPA: hypothetical protein VMT90_07635 [Dehalococcoidia bacterium]|nr:hypothetical protein [Dehalococcoidia bacterium]